MNKEKLFKENKKWIDSYAGHLAAKWKISRDDVISEACLLFSKAVDKFDETRGIQFNTYFTHQLKALSGGSEYKGKLSGGTHGICRNEKQLKNTTLSIEDFEFNSSELSFVRLAEFKSMVKELKPDSRVLLEQIFETGEIIKLPAAQYYFKEVYNWAKKRTAAAWGELAAFWQAFDSAYAGY